MSSEYSSSSSPYQAERPPRNHNRHGARPPNHIPRPPNSWILFRTDIIERCIIPADVESKQHNISRIISNYWNRLPNSEKTVWEALAKLKKEEHERANPGYKFRRQKRSGAVQKRKRATTIHEELAYCKKVSEKYSPAATGPVDQVSKPPRQRKSRVTARDEDDCPVFMNPLLPPQIGEEASHPSMDTALVSPVFSDVAAVPSTEPDTEDNWTVQQPAPIIAPVPRKPPYNTAIHIRENFEISRRGAIVPTVEADYQDAQAWYNQQPFFAPSGDAQQTPLHPMPTSCRQAPHSSLERNFPCPEQIGPVCSASSSASSSHDPLWVSKDFAAPSGSAEPQRFPITLRSSASSPPKSIVLRPPQFDTTPDHLDTLTISFDGRTLEDFSAGLGVDDEFGLFGQPPSMLLLGSELESTLAWSSRMMSDVLSQDVCSRKA